MVWRFFQSKIFTLLSLTVVGLLVWALFKIEPQRIVIEKRIKNFQDKIAEMEKANAKIGPLLDYFKSDAYLEREAKLKLNVRRPEEGVVFLQESDTRPTTTAVPVERQARIWGVSYLVDFWRWVGGLF